MSLIGFFIDAVFKAADTAVVGDCCCTPQTTLSRRLPIRNFTLEPNISIPLKYMWIIYHLKRPRRSEIRSNNCGGGVTSCNDTGCPALWRRCAPREASSWGFDFMTECFRVDRHVKSRGSSQKAEKKSSNGKSLQRRCAEKGRHEL